MREGRSGRRARAHPTAPVDSALIRRSLEEDRAFSDLTTRLVLPRPVTAHAVVRAQARGVLAGMGPATAVARSLRLRVHRTLRDGSLVRAGTVVLELRGDVRKILAGERTLLNFLMHLSGVATLTARVVARARTAARGRTILVLATRKTTPGLRDLEKSAVVAGGGQPHRRDLASAVLIKNNHLAVVPLAEAVRRARGSARPRRRVQVEVRSRRDARVALKAGADALLLDNLSPARVRVVMHDIHSLARHRRVTVEASGGITLANVGAYARSGVDAVSLGVLTHSAPALPFHLTVRSVSRVSRAP